MTPSADPYGDSASRYDKGSVESDWYGPQMMFGLMFAHVSPGESLLDLGIGTGLSAMPFHRAGLRIHGLDTSPAMLAECRRKEPGFDLTQHDLTQMPWPFDDASFHHAVSTGVFHFVGDLKAVLLETARVLKPHGAFGFDIYEYNPARDSNCEKLADGIYTKKDEEYGHCFYRHTEEYVMRAIKEAGFELLHDTAYLASKPGSICFRALVVRRKT